MTLLNLEEVYARRWPFALLILTGALLFLVFVLLFPSDPLYLCRICIFMFVTEWSGALRARIKAVGLRPERLVHFLCGLLVIATCTLVFFAVPDGRFLTPALFVLLHLPLVLRNEKSREGAPPAIT